jgi:hypothetical protein
VRAVSGAGIASESRRFLRFFQEKYKHDIDFFLLKSVAAAAFGKCKVQVVSAMIFGLSIEKTLDNRIGVY